MLDNIDHITHQSCIHQFCLFRLHIFPNVFFSHTGVVSNSGMIYVIGGDDGSTNLDSVECYDPKSNTWTLLHLSMTTGRSYAGVAIVDKNC